MKPFKSIMKSAMDISIVTIIGVVIYTLLPPCLAYAQTSPMDDFAEVKREIEPRIDAARKNLAVAKTPAAQARAQQALSNVLDEKEAYYLYGETGGLGTSAFVVDLAGGIDGGIPTQAKNHFLAWSQAARRSWGAKTDMDSVSPALVIKTYANGKTWNDVAAKARKLPEYTNYKRLRDEIEFERAGLTHPGASKGLPPPSKIGPKELAKSRVYPLSELPVNAFTGETREPMMAAANKGQRVIDCQYGAYVNEGGSGAVVYSFWYQQAPADVNSWIHKADRTRMQGLGTRAVSKCPTTLAEAERR